MVVVLVRLGLAGGGLLPPSPPLLLLALPLPTSEVPPELPLAESRFCRSDDDEELRVLPPLFSALSLAVPLRLEVRTVVSLSSSSDSSTAALLSVEFGGGPLPLRFVLLAPANWLTRADGCGGMGTVSTA